MYNATKSTKLYLCKKINWLIHNFVYTKCSAEYIIALQFNRQASFDMKIEYALADIHTNKCQWSTQLVILQDFESMKIITFFPYRKMPRKSNEMNEIFTVQDESLTAEFSELWSLLWRCCLISLSSIHTRSPYIDSLSAGWQHHSYKGPFINDVSIFQWG